MMWGGWATAAVGVVRLTEFGVCVSRSVIFWWAKKWAVTMKTWGTQPPFSSESASSSFGRPLRHVTM